MSEVRLLWHADWSSGRGHAIEVRVVDLPTRALGDGRNEMLTVEVYLGSGYRSFTADEAERLGEALIAAAREGRSHVLQAAAVAGDGRP